MMAQDFDISAPSLPLGQNLSLEASAGTGKTYSLERMVARLILEHRIPLPQILVVTFTEKATAEMKSRIRSLLQEWISLYPQGEEHRLLKEALKSFDQAAIYTIHGFCRFLLNAYPLESKEPFSTEVENQSDLYSQAIYDYLGRVSSRIHPGNYSAFRGLFTDFDSMASFLQDWIKNRRSDPEFFEIRPDENETQQFEDLIASFDSHQGPAYALWQAVVGQRSLWLPWLDSFPKSQKRVHKAALKAMAELPLETRSFVDAFEVWNTKVGKLSLWQVMESLRSSSIEKTLAEWEMEEVGIPEAVGKAVDTLESFWSFLSLVFNAKTGKDKLDAYGIARFLREHPLKMEELIQKRKRKRSVIDFSDMIEKVYLAVKEGEANPLVQAVRQRFSTVLVDEFQDTDPRQWGIFSNIFNTPKHNYILIGDPKQSIYRFRGADLEVYFKAVKTVDTRFRLGSNYRSGEKVVQGCNLLFDSIFSLHSGQGHPLSFESVKSQPQKAWLLEPEKPPIHLLALPENPESEDVESLASLKARYRRMAAYEIYRLLTSGTPLVRGEERRSLELQDIALLVESNEEVGLLQKELRNYGIPCVISKDQNVFFSQGADDFLFLLEALANPSKTSFIKRALMLPYFNLDPAQVFYLEDKGGLEVLFHHFKVWSDLTNRGQLYKAFQQITHRQALWYEEIAPILEEQFSAQRLSYWDRQLILMGGERHLTDSRHLLELLAQEQSRTFCDAQALFRHFQLQRQQGFSQANIRLDQDSQAVQIMTMHKSKGLEFPVVFFFGGLQGGTRDQRTFFVEYIGKKNRILDFHKEAQGIHFSRCEEWEEKKRLYYVAATRSVARLYLPVAENSKLSLLQSFWASLGWSTVRSYLKNIGFQPEQPLTSTLKSGERLFIPKEYKRQKDWEGELSRLIYKEVLQFCQDNSSLFYVDPHKEAELPEPGEEPLYAKVSKDTPELECRSFDPGLLSSNPPYWVSSYSSLASGSHELQEKAQGMRTEIQLKDVEWDDEGESQASQEESFPEAVLPKGPEFGDMVHKIMEEIDFALAKAPSFVEFWSKERIKWFQSMGGSFFKGIHGSSELKLLGELVYSTLTIPIKTSHGEICLCDLTPQQKRAEAEFYIHVPKETSLTLDRGWRVQKGYVKGFIDLLFEVDGRIYILDWKTNYLGEQEDAYTPEALQQVMRDHQYHLQYHLYLSALVQYLDLTYPQGWLWEEKIGGVIYLFLRGTPSGQGIYYDYPSRETLELFSPLLGGV